MARAWLRRLVLAAATVAGPVALASEPPAPEDYLRVLTNGPWPIEILAFCYATIDRDAAFQAVGARWRARNDGLLASVEQKAAGLAISPDIRRKADEAALAAIRRLAARQYDKAAWCRTIAGVIDRGAYDLDRRRDLEPALKRIFGKE